MNGGAEGRERERQRKLWRGKRGLYLRVQKINTGPSAERPDK
jgi:hypothetical protein